MARRSKNQWGKLFVNFCPAVSNKAKKSIGQTLRSWGLHLKSDKSLEDLARMFNPVLRGWINYYGKYYKSGLYPIFHHMNRILVSWATRKFKRLRNHRRRARHWLGNIAKQSPKLFGHWQFGVKPATGQ